MYPKRKIQIVVDSLMPSFVSMLKLESYKIELTVVAPKEDIEILRPYKEAYGNLAGLTLFLDATKPTYAKIFIFSKECSSKKDAINTLVHELLHIKFRSIDKYIPKSRLAKAHIAEEEFVKRAADLAVLLIEPKVLAVIDWIDTQ